MTNTIIPGTNAFLAAAKKLVKYGEITEEQYQEMVLRNESVPESEQADIIYID